MKKHLYLLVVFAILLSFSGTGVFADVTVIANKNISETSLSNSEIKKISLGKIVKWSDNTPVHFVTLEGDIHQKFLKKLSSAISASTRFIAPLPTFWESKMGKRQWNFS